MISGELKSFIEKILDPNLDSELFKDLRSELSRFATIGDYSDSIKGQEFEMPTSDFALLHNAILLNKVAFSIDPYIDKNFVGDRGGRGINEIIASLINEKLKLRSRGYYDENDMQILDELYPIFILQSLNSESSPLNSDAKTTKLDKRLCKIVNNREFIKALERQNFVKLKELQANIIARELSFGKRFWNGFKSKFGYPFLKIHKANSIISDSLRVSSETHSKTGTFFFRFIANSISILISGFTMGILSPRIQAKGWFTKNAIGPLLKVLASIGMFVGVMTLFGLAGSLAASIVGASLSAIMFTFLLANSVRFISNQYKKINIKGSVITRSKAKSQNEEIQRSKVQDDRELFKMTDNSSSSERKDELSKLVEKAKNETSKDILKVESLNQYGAVRLILKTGKDTKKTLIVDVKNDVYISYEGSGSLETMSLLSMFHLISKVLRFTDEESRSKAELKQHIRDSSPNEHNSLGSLANGGEGSESRLSDTQKDRCSAIDRDPARQRRVGRVSDTSAMVTHI